MLLCEIIDNAKMLIKYAKLITVSTSIEAEDREFQKLSFLALLAPGVRIRPPNNTSVNKFKTILNFIFKSIM